MRQITVSRRGYWSQNLRIISALLLLCCSATFGVSYFARDMSFHFFGWPFSFWMGAQGAPAIYCLIVWFYAHAMRRLDAAQEREREAD